MIMKKKNHPMNIPIIITYVFPIIIIIGKEEDIGEEEEGFGIIKEEEEGMEIGEEEVIFMEWEMIKGDLIIMEEEEVILEDIKEFIEEEAKWIEVIIDIKIQDII